MCKDLELNLMGKIPLDPFIMISCEKGKFVGDTEQENQEIKQTENKVRASGKVATDAYNSIIKVMLEKLKIGKPE